MGIRTKSITGDNAFGIEELKFAKETGFDIIELSFNSTQFDYHDKGSGKYFSREAEKLSIHLSAHAPDILNMASTDKNNVSDSIKKCKTIIDGVSIYGVKTLVIHADTKQPVIPGKESIQMDHLVFALASLVPKCKEKEIYLAVETLTPGRLTSSIDNLITAIDAVNSPLIGICIDTNHSNLSMNLSATIIKANRRIIEFHINTDFRTVTNPSLSDSDARYSLRYKANKMLRCIERYIMWRYNKCYSIFKTIYPNHKPRYFVNNCLN